MMKNSKKWMCCAVLFLCLTVLGTSFFMMSQAEPIIPEDYEGLVILEDPALLGGPEDEEETEAPATEPPATEAPATEVPTTEPTQEPEPTDMPTLEPTALPEAAYEIVMVPPEGWYLNRAVMELTIADLNGIGWENVKITLNSLTLIDGELPSGHMWIELLDNCDVMVTVTDPYGQEYNEKVEIRCFDHAAPELKASIQEEFLQVEASDAQSGVAAIQVNGTVYDHTSQTNGRLELSLKQYADAYEQLLVQAVDRVGNTSKAIAAAKRCWDWLALPCWREAERCGILSRRRARNVRRYRTMTLTMTRRKNQIRKMSNTAKRDGRMKPPVPCLISDAR